MRLGGWDTTVNADLDTVVILEVGSGKSWLKMLSLANGSGVPPSSYLWVCLGV